MKKLNRNQSIAVFVGLAFVAYLMFGSTIMEFFNLSETSANPMNTSTGVSIEEIVVGQGLVAEPGDVLTVHYVGSFTDGRVFESSKDANVPFTFTLGAGRVIRGWEEGIRGMRAGGKRRLTISPEYGYGAQAVGPIPANSTLIFEVDLLNVQKSN